MVFFVLYQQEQLSLQFDCKIQFFLLDECLDLFLQDEHICWSNEATGFFSFSSRRAWNAHSTVLKVTLSKAFRIQCIKPESILVTAWPDLPKVSEEHSLSCGLAGVPDLGCALSVWLAEGRGDVLLVLPGTAVESAVEVLREPEPATDHQLNLLEQRSDLLNCSLVKLRCICYRSSRFWLRSMKSTHESFQLLSIPNAY